MRRILHQYIEYQYDTLDELRADIDNLKADGFDICDGIQRRDGSGWSINVIHTEPNSRNKCGSAYGGCRKYHILDMYHRPVIDGQN